MNWKTIVDIAIWVCGYFMAVTLIEYQGDKMVDLAGDLFGALGLMFIAVERALRDN